MEIRCDSKSILHLSLHGKKPQLFEAFGLSFGVEYLAVVFSYSVILFWLLRTLGEVWEAEKMAEEFVSTPEFGENFVADSTEMANAPKPEFPLFWPLFCLGCVVICHALLELVQVRRKPFFLFIEARLRELIF